MNEQLIKEREVFVLQELVLDEIHFWKSTFKEKRYVKSIINCKELLFTLEDLYSSINQDNILEIKEEYKFIIIQLLQERINSLEDDSGNSTFRNDEEISNVLNLILMEYHLLINQFLLSVTKDKAKKMEQ